jgi:hypothetical protein
MTKSNRIDEIFSVKQLRKSWTRARDISEQLHETDIVQPDYRNMMSVFDRLSDIIGRRFSKDQGEVLDLILGELKDLLQKRFPKTKETETVENDPAVLDTAIGETLNQIEDLVEAFELGNRK